ncbi:hypothetical protein FNF31_01160 [Cafeteria roenbergensis]|uniref:Transmembrane protein 65 n=1 Tax=Cafeteria roenbergensis TaxID=33653 RepID=A0A5A8DN01_CAFRO|nr:hypothetical protein FNF31_01160 [Cafeteria roenbergensis]
MLSRTGLAGTALSRRGLGVRKPLGHYAVRCASPYHRRDGIAPPSAEEIDEAQHCLSLAVRMTERRPAAMREAAGRLNIDPLQSALGFPDGASALGPEDPGELKPLTAKQAGVVALAAGIPAVAFGFTDNFIMLVAGTEIDAFFGVKMGLSTMAAAGLGNLVSDVMGTGFEGFIERNFAIKQPRLTRAQRRSDSYKYSQNFGKILGIAIGCLLGMVPLLIVLPRWAKQRLESGKRALGVEPPGDRAERLAGEAERSLAAAVAKHGDELAGADMVRLLLLRPGSGARGGDGGDAAASGPSRGSGAASDTADADAAANSLDWSGTVGGRVRMCAPEHATLGLGSEARAALAVPGVADGGLGEVGAGSWAVRAAKRAVAAAAAGSGSGAEEDAGPPTAAALAREGGAAALGGRTGQFAAAGAGSLLGSTGAWSAAGGGTGDAHPSSEGLAVLRGGVVALRRRVESGSELLQVAAAAAAVRRPVSAAFCVPRASLSLAGSAAGGGEEGGNASLVAWARSALGADSLDDGVVAEHQRSAYVAGTITSWPVRAPTSAEPHAVLVSVHQRHVSDEQAGAFAMDADAGGLCVPDAATAEVTIPTRFWQAVGLSPAAEGPAQKAASSESAEGWVASVLRGLGWAATDDPPVRLLLSARVLQSSSTCDSLGPAGAGSRPRATIPTAAECRSMFVLASVVAPPLESTRKALREQSSEEQADAAEALSALVLNARASLTGMAEHF